MPPQGPLFLRIEREVRGPCGPELLMDLARSGVITPATEASVNAGGPWLPLQVLADYAAIFPPRPETRFGAKVFEDVNRSPALPVDYRELIAAANRPALSSPTGKTQQPSNSPPSNEVADILRENVRIQAQF